MVRIGILLTNPDWERQKAELVKYKKSDPDEFPWNKYIPKKAIVKRTWHIRKVGSAHGVASDRTVGAMIMHAFEKDNVEVDFIEYDAITKARLKSNDLNFILIYDLLECYTMGGGNSAYFRKVKDALTTAKNIFPPMKYQRFINSKITYYNYFKEHKVGILPTLTMTKVEYKKLGQQKAVQQVLDRIQAQGWNKFCAKPEYGQDGRDVKFFKPVPDKKLDEHIKFCMKKWPGLIFQKYIKDFGETVEGAEMRMFYCGDNFTNKYAYSVCAGRNFDYCLEDSVDRHKLKIVPVGLLKRASQRVIKKLPKIVMPNGMRLPRLITRIDMGYNNDGKVQPFVNEVEFCPSYYVENAPLPHMTKYLQSIAKQMVRITKMYKKQRSSLRKPSPGHYLKRKARTGRRS